MRDAAGSPIAEALVYIVGTAFSGLTNPRGYYFINNVPAGAVSLRGVFIGYHPLEVRELRVHAGQTVSQDFLLEAAPIELQEISVVAAVNVLVPRDEVATKQPIEGGYVDRLPVDQLINVIALQPGVVADRKGQTLSIRGGRPSENAVYIDGVPVTGIQVATSALEEASVTTGATSAEFGNFQSGVISIQTRGGGTSYHGSFSYETDEPFGVNHSLGFNRVEAGFGGPIVNRLSFFVSGVLSGAQTEEAGKNANRNPVFVPAGVDTTVAVPSDTSGTADTTYVDVEKFAIYRGQCGTFQHSADSGIRGNYGLPCQGIRLPADPQSSYQFQGKVSYTYGTGSRLSFTALRSQTQSRPFDYRDLYNPQILTGDRVWNSVFTLNWTQNLARTADRALALDTYLSLQQDREIRGPMTPAGEQATRDPFGGFLIKPLDFRWDFGNFPVNQELLNNFRINKGRRSPLDPGSPTQYQTIDQYRNNAYGAIGWPESGGPNGRLFLSREDRAVLKSNLDWQVDRYNRLKIGAEGTRYAIARYSHDLASTKGDLYIEHPVRWNAFAENRLDLGDVVLVAGLRYDWYDSRASRPDFPRVSTNPAFDPANPTALFRRDRSHHYLSPHVQVSFPVTTRTNFRFSYAHQVQTPDWSFILRGINGDVSVGGGQLGADLDFGKTILFEFGIRHAFSDDMVLDLSAYNKDNLANVSLRTIPQFDSVVGRQVSTIFFTNADYGNTRGLDVRLDRRIGTLFNGTVGYTFQDAKSTGSDPFVNFSRAVGNVNAVGGGLLPPPQGILPTASSRPHTIAGQLALNFPNQWHGGTGIGAVLQNLGIFAVFRLAAGTAYTPCQTGPGNAGIFSGGDCVQFSGAVNGARLPAFKQLDIRITRGFLLHGVDLTAYLDVRNVLNFTNTHTVFSSTGTTTNPADRQQRWAADSAGYADEAAGNRVRGADGSIDLSFQGAAASGCGHWVTAGQIPAPPDCVYLIRAEERYGDGDHIFTLAEQRRADDAYYGAVGDDETFFGRGLNNLTGPPRLLRVGIEVNF